MKQLSARQVYVASIVVIGISFVVMGRVSYLIGHEDGRASAPTTSTQYRALHRVGPGDSLHYYHDPADPHAHWLLVGDRHGHEMFRMNFARDPDRVQRLVKCDADYRAQARETRP